MFSILIALRLPKPVCRRLATLCFGIPSAHWELEQNFVLSLFPVGRVDDILLDDVKEALKQLALEPVTIVLNGLQGTTIGSSQARVWASVEMTSSLELLQKKLQAALRPLGLQPAKEKLIPHIDLGIVPARSFERLAEYLANNASFCHPPFQTEKISLFSLQTTTKGVQLLSIVEYPEPFP